MSLSCEFQLEMWLLISVS